MITFSPPSCDTTHVPTIGSNVTGTLPACSPLRSTLISAARAVTATTSNVRRTGRYRQNDSTYYNQCRPHGIEQHAGAFWRHRERMAAKNALIAILRRRNAGERVNRL